MSGWTDIQRDLSAYADRDPSTDTEWVAALPGIIAYGQRRVARDFGLSAHNVEIGGAMVAGTRTIARPPNMIAAGLLKVNLGNDTWQPLRQRPRSWLQEFWPYEAQTRPPRYWSLNDETTCLIGPTPDQAYAYKILGRVLPQMLGDAVPDTVISNEHYDALLTACLLRAAIYAHEDRRTDLLARAQAEYGELRSLARKAELDVTMADFDAPPDSVTNA